MNEARILVRRCPTHTMSCFVTMFFFFQRKMCSIELNQSLPGTLFVWSFYFGACIAVVKQLNQFTVVFLLTYCSRRKISKITLVEIFSGNCVAGLKLTVHCLIAAHSCLFVCFRHS